MKQLPFIFSDQWKYRLQRHLAFWFFWLVFQGFLYSFMSINSRRGYLESLPLSMLESLIFGVAHIFLAYSLIYLVIPRFLLRQKYWLASALTILLFFITACISAVLGITVIDQLRVNTFGDVYAKSPFRPASLSFHLSLLAGLRGGLTVAGIAAAIKLMKYWYVKEQRNLQLQKENMESQLKLLKAQLHPHFLFNTLNNIYSFTQNTSPVASRMLSRLSDLLRYVLYEANQPEVPLERELKMLRDYMDLEKVRYGNQLDLDIQLPAQTSGYQIAPLLLLPFVENCFKHGTSQVIDQPWISLHLDMHANELQMRLVNGKIPGHNNKQSSAGIGIENVKRRLELIYPGRHDLVINSEEDVFIVNLRLQLNKISGLQIKKEQLLQTNA